MEDYLWAVVSLPAGVFNPYSGVKTSILLMDKSLAKKTDNILFVKIDNDGFDLGAQRRPIEKNDLPQVLDFITEYKKAVIEGKEAVEDMTFAHVVEKNKIEESGDWNLSGERYQANRQIQNHNWEMIHLGDERYFQIEAGGTPSSKNPTFWNGDINWVALVDLPQENFITEITKSKRRITKEGLAKSSAKLMPANSILVSSRATIGRIAISRTQLATNQGFKNIVIKDFNSTDVKFVALTLTKLVDEMIRMASGGTFKEISKTSFCKLKIPLPPLDVQKAIVEEIDGYQKIIDGARQVVDNYKPTIKIDPDWEMVELGNVAATEYGHSESGKESGDTRFVRISDIDKNGKLKDSGFKYINLSEESRPYLLTKGNVVVARTGATYGKTLLFDAGFQAVFAGYLIRLNFDNKKITNEYYWVFAQSENYIKQKESLVQGGGQPQFNANAIKKIKIPLPTLSVQQEIVAQTKLEQEKVNVTKELIEIFEQKIKDKISEVWGE